MKSIILGAAALLLVSNTSRADILYTYKTSPINLLYQISPVTNNNPDNFTLEFLSPFTLAPGSYYDINAFASSDVISRWNASDSLFGYSLSGVNATVSLAQNLNLGVLSSDSCTTHQAESCLVGAIGTNESGQIYQWNLVVGESHVGEFITYNSLYLGSVDVISATNGFWINQYSEQTGSWNGVVPPTYSGVAPEPSAWAMMLLGFAGLGFKGYRQTRRASPALNA